MARDGERRPDRTEIESSAAFKNEWLLLISLIIFRIINALSIQTFFQPDEYFQSLEPAWQAAFGAHSGAWITWEWRERLRSSMHPLLFAAVYRGAAGLSRTLRLDEDGNAELLVLAPKLLQACFAAIMDFYTWRLAGKTYGRGNSHAKAALCLTICSPWQWFCSTRTLSNCLETTLTVFALDAWPWDWFLQQRQQSTTVNASISAPEHVNRKLVVSLTAAAVACILRPTNVAIWAAISGYIALRYASRSKTLLLLSRVMMCGSGVLAVSVALDRSFYQTWTLPPLRFLHFNVVQSLAVFYGRNRPDYYLTEGLPLLLTTALPFTVTGIYQASLSLNVFRQNAQDSLSDRARGTFAITIASTVLMLSLIAHKEVRFIYPLLPMLHVLAAQPLASFFAPFPIPQAAWKRVLLGSLFSANICIAGYVSLLHQRGVIDVMHHLRHTHTSDGPTMANTTVAFLMPCHSTPWRSHLIHPRIKAWALTCEPPLDIPLGERGSYLDEADQFYADPNGWLHENMADTPIIGQDATGAKDPHRRQWPDFLVFFEQLEPTMLQILDKTSYTESWRGFNTHWHDDSRRHGDIVVWSKGHHQA